MKMDAIIKPAPQHGLELVRKEVPTISEGEALVKVRYSAICGTDVHIYEWNQWAQDTIKAPMTIGHEFVGEIVEIKDNQNSSFKVGDLVSAEGHVVCGKCRNCLADAKHLCPHTSGIGVNRDGIFAEYARIPISNLWKCDKDIPEKMYAIFDPFGNATHTALKFNTVGEDVLITGAGPIGIMAAAICKHVGANNVVLTDISDYRLDLAKQVCPEVIAVNTRNIRISEIQKQLGMTDGFGVGLEMSGSSIAFNEMLDNMLMGGKVAMLGLQGANTTINWNKFIFSMITLQGIYGREIFGTWHKMTEMLKNGLDISKIITGEYNYRDFEKGFADMMSGKSGKIILDWTK